MIAITTTGGWHSSWMTTHAISSWEWQPVKAPHKSWVGWPQACSPQALSPIQQQVWVLVVKKFITTWFGVCTTYGKVFCVFWYSTTARERETKKRNKILYCFSKIQSVGSDWVRDRNKAENIAVAWFDWCSKISERCPSLCKYMRTRDLHHWLGDSCLVRRGWDVKVG